MNHFVDICALIIASTNAITGATQVQYQVHPFSATSHTAFCAFLWRSISASLGASSTNVQSGAPLDCTVKWILKCHVKCIFFFKCVWISKCSLKWNVRCALKCIIECTLKFIFSLNVHHYVYLYVELSGYLKCTLKVGLSSSENFCIICSTESPLKMMKNAFYCIVKTLFVLKMFKFLSWLFGHVEKTVWLERLTAKLMALQPD